MERESSPFLLSTEDPACDEEEGKIELYLSALMVMPAGKRPPGMEINGIQEKPSS